MALATTGCASGPEPTEQDIWHESGLRPGQVPAATPGEREVLARMAEIPAGQAVTLAGQVFIVDEPYHAASGRTCRSVTIRAAREAGGTDVRLACAEDGGWVFVPDPFGPAQSAGPIAERAR